MPLTDSMRDTLDQLRSQEKKLLDELNGLRFTIKSLERIAGVESQDASSSDALPDTMPVPSRQDMPPTANGTGGGKITIRPDDFFGLTHAEAARRYLKKVGHAVSFAEMVDVLRRGGCKLTSTDPEHVLWISLIKNSKDFVPPQSGYVGLREFYPARARSASDQRAKQSKRPTKKRSKSTSAKSNGKSKTREKPPKKAASPNTPAPEEPKRIPLAVHEFMGDKQFHALDEVIEAVRKKIGNSSVLNISVRGALSSRKAFEKNEDGLYRLVN